MSEQEFEEALQALVNAAGNGEVEEAEALVGAEVSTFEEHGARERPRVRRGKVRRSSAREGVFKPTTRRILADLGWTWHPTMQIGSGCTVRLIPGDLPMGRLVVQVSKHLTAVIDGVIHDTYDPQREVIDHATGHVAHRCVYGYWTKEAPCGS